MLKNKFFFVDAETDGLYGNIISVAVIITDGDCKTLSTHYMGVRKENLVVTNQWVRENVVPKLGDYTPYESEYDLLEAVWTLWHESGATWAVADCCCPVESHLFRKCVEHNPEERMFQGPFPLVDIASMKVAKGLDPIATLQEYAHRNGGEQHNALYDVETTIMEYRALLPKP